MKRFFIILIIAVAVLEIIGDILFKEWTIHNKNYLIIIGIISYLFATVIWAFSLRYQNLSKAIVIFAVLTLIVGALVGVLIYREELTSLNILGIIFGLISIILLEL